LTAEVLLAHALHCDRAWLYAHPEERLSDKARIHFGRYLSERSGGKPTQYITHVQEFFGREFYVNEDVLIPRPETEHIVEAALEIMRAGQHRRVLDLGTGSGAIAVTLSVESHQEIFASDISVASLRVAQRNARQLGANVAFAAADLLSEVRPQSIDLLVSNPPYVPGADAANMQREVREWEPHVALFAGDTGLEIYSALLKQAELTVRAGGRILLELGYQSLDGVQALLADKWTDVTVVSDLAGWPRVIGARLRG
jgi:release factor glutamine methyltransferase